MFRLKCQYSSDLVEDRLVPLVEASGHFRKFVRVRGFFLSPFRCIGSFPICKVTVMQLLSQTNLKNVKLINYKSDYNFLVLELIWHLTEGGTYPQLPTQPKNFVHISNWYDSLIWSPWVALRRKIKIWTRGKKSSVYYILKVEFSRHKL